MSRPTEIMFVAMATSTRSFSWNGRASRRLASATLSVLHAGGQLDRPRRRSCGSANGPSFSPTRLRLA